MCGHDGQQRPTKIGDGWNGSRQKASNVEADAANEIKQPGFSWAEHLVAPHGNIWRKEGMRWPPASSEAGFNKVPFLSVHVIGSTRYTNHQHQQQEVTTRHVVVFVSTFSQQHWSTNTFVIVSMEAREQDFVVCGNLHSLRTTSFTPQDLG